MVRDAVVLSLPLAPVCTEDCAGLCAGCGQRLDDLPADHSHEVRRPALGRPQPEIRFRPTICRRTPGETRTPEEN